MTKEVTIEIECPRVFQGVTVSGEVTSLGTPGDYKPCVAKLPSGELVLVAFSAMVLSAPARKQREEILLFRSGDGGRTWSTPQNLTADMGHLGREPYLTILTDGTMFLTVHTLSTDVRNPAGYSRSCVHRSEDGGRTWTTVLAQPDGIDPTTGSTVTTRNILEMHDGSLMLGVSGRGLGLSDSDYVWRSHDRGRSWSERDPIHVEGLGEDYPFPFLGEAVLWQTANGKVYVIARADPRYLPQPGDVVPSAETFNDQCDRMTLYEITDEGRAVRPVRALGVLGEMYPALLRLNDGRLLLTFTVRRLRTPLGVRAVIGEEVQDDLRFDMEHDRFLLDTKTAPDVASGGGFGRTVQLDDETLVTSYSWRDAEHVTHIEVVRWRLPD